MEDPSQARAHPRIDTQIAARFLVNSEESGRGVAINISAGGVAIASETPVQIGDHIILHLAGAMRVEGAVVRLIDEGFCIALEISASRREKLKQNIDMMSHDENPPTRVRGDRRIAERVPGPEGHNYCRTADGVFKCRVVDMSLNGLAIRVEGEIAMGAWVIVGKTGGRVVRADGDLYGIEFDESVRAENGTEHGCVDVGALTNIAQGTAGGAA
ncbi:MAG: PilZ domain-containing protein [Pseudomonadota bacterium]